MHTHINKDSDEGQPADIYFSTFWKLQTFIFPEKLYSHNQITCFVWRLSPRCSRTTPWLYRGGVEFPTHTLGLHLITYTLGHMFLCCLPPLLDFTGKSNWLHRTVTLFVLSCYNSTFNIGLDNYMEFLCTETSPHPLTHKHLWLISDEFWEQFNSNTDNQTFLSRVLSRIWVLKTHVLRNELYRYLHRTWGRATSCECHFLDPNGNRHFAKDKEIPQPVLREACFLWRLGI